MKTRRKSSSASDAVEKWLIACSQLEFNALVRHLKIKRSK